ncbi:PAS domain-containing sensor histidine kinase [uncultured Cyclobacterium sp.]|uniref:PAS domain-containing sensor histidine kinase n=1 Tax=uncultured Cyclobacterium sp. TaxID=453820 RepID=UPI0030EBC3F7
MFENIFKSQLLTFKKLHDGEIEVLYQSNDTIPWEDRELKSLNKDIQNDIYSTQNVSLLIGIFNQLRKSDHFETFLLLDRHSFVKVKIEGCIVPHGENEFLVNAMVNQIPCNSGRSWLIYTEGQRVLTELGSPKTHPLSKVNDLEQYLWAEYPQLKEKFGSLLTARNPENIKIESKGFKFKINNICSSYYLISVEEPRTLKPSSKKIKKQGKIVDFEQHEKIYFKYLKKTQEVLWAGPLFNLLGYEDGNFRSFYIWDWLNLIHPEDKQKVEDFISQDQYGKNYYSINYRVKHKKGHYQEVKNNVRFFQSPYTFEEGLTGNLINISDHQYNPIKPKSKEGLIKKLSEKKFIQGMLTEVSAISSLFKGKNLFEEINFLIYKKLGFKYCLIGNLSNGNKKMEVLSLCDEGKKLSDKDGKWSEILNKELLSLDSNNNFLMISSENSECLANISILAKQQISSLIRLKLSDTERNEIGTLCLLHDQPIKNKTHYSELFGILRDWISKELYRFRFETMLQETNYMHDAILNGTAYAIFSVNHQFEPILINNKTLPLLNIKDKEDLLKTILIKDNKRKSLRQVIINFLKTNRKVAYFHLPCKGSLDKELKISFTRVLYGKENKESYVVFVDDITERTLSEKKLIASEQLYRSIAGNFPRGTVDVLDKNYCYLFTDGEEYKLSGIDPKSFIGTNLLKQFTGKTLKVVKSNLSKVLEGQRVSFETETKSNKYLQSAVPLMNDANEVDRILLVKQNITEAKKLESDRLNLIKDLKSHNEELLRFAYIVSHNLRAPIVNISLLLDLYNEDDPSDPENQEVWENLKISTNLLDSTLQDLIEVVSIKKQKIPKVEHIDFKLLLNNIEKSLYNQLKESGIVINKDFTALNDINYIYAHLENFLMNIMTNAVKYKHPERNPIVNIKTYRDGKYCVIRFEDNGIGIDLSRYGDRIFGLYQRFHTHVEGKGLGLYLVREQIRAHDGKIEVESKVGKGTIFRIYLRNLIINQP